MCLLISSRSCYSKSGEKGPDKYIKRTEALGITWLFLGHNIIFYFKITLKNFKKNLSPVLNSFENIMENGAFVPEEQMLHFPSIVF